jgi:hypothetical protein
MKTRKFQHKVSGSVVTISKGVNGSWFVDFGAYYLMGSKSFADREISFFARHYVEIEA